MEEENRLTFGERVLKRLRIKNITQKELAEEIGSSTACVSRYINDVRAPKGEVVAAIAKALDTTTDYLLGLKEEI